MDGGLGLGLPVRDRRVGRAARPALPVDGRGRPPRAGERAAPRLCPAHVPPPAQPPSPLIPPALARPAATSSGGKDQRVPPAPVCGPLPRLWRAARRARNARGGRRQPRGLPSRARLPRGERARGLRRRPRACRLRHAALPRRRGSRAAATCSRPRSRALCSAAHAAQPSVRLLASDAGALGRRAQRHGAAALSLEEYAANVLPAYLPVLAIGWSAGRLLVAAGAEGGGEAVASAPSGAAAAAAKADRRVEGGKGRAKAA